MLRTVGGLFIGGALAAAAFLATSAREPAPRPHTDLERQIEALSSELAALRSDVGRVDRSLGRVGHELGVAVITKANEPAAAAPLSAAERAAAVARNIAERQARERAYYERLDQQMVGKPAAPATRERLQKNIEAVRATWKAGPAPLVFERVDCTESLCRLELEIKTPAGRDQLNAAARQLMTGMGSLTMRAFDGRKIVVYASPADQPLPSMDL